MLNIAHLVVISLFFVLSNGSVSMHNPFYCYSQDPIRPQIRMFAAETAYETIRGDSIDANASSCTPSKFWTIGRHGMRLFSANDLDKIFAHAETVHRDILSNYDAGRTSLCAADMTLIRNWRFNPNVTYENAQQLTVSGWNEVQGIAQRYQLAFPTLLPSNYSPTHYLFRSSSLPGTISSVAAFADGLFGLNGHYQVEFEGSDNPDFLLQPHTNCPLFNAIDPVEDAAFAQGPEFQEMITQVSNKLGFHASRILSADQVEALLMICRFEQIYNLTSTSALCGAFSVANQAVFEYYQDLNRYHLVGYGQISNYRQLYEYLTCHLMQNMLHFLRSTDPNEQRARIFNSDGHLLRLMLTTFGAYRDEVPLHRHNFAQQTFRQYRTSFISGKASNVAVIKYDCDGGDSDVLFLHNERPLQIVGCQSNGLCKLSMLLDRFNRFLDVNCNDVYCRNN